MSSAFTFEPIGIVRSPFVEKAEAPRQATAAPDVEATIELYPGRDLEHAVEDLAGWERIWILFVFHHVTGWRPKVLPPRSEKRRGVLATRSPHRPNPIGMSAVRLVAVEGLCVRVRDVDILDGTPVLDLKPYVPYADAFPEAGSGWLEGARDPIATWAVGWSSEARAQVEWLAARGIDLAGPVEQALALGPRPNAYRRIRKDGDAQVLAVKEWRARFREAEGGVQAIVIERLTTGYRPRELATDDAPGLDVHRAFVAAFGG